MARAAVRLGHDVVIFAPAYDLQPAAGKEAQRLQITRFPGGIFKAKNFPMLVWRTHRLLTRASYNCVHAADWPMVLVCRLLQRFRKFDYTATVHGTDVPIIAQSRLSRTFRTTDACQRASRLLANSNFTMELVRNEWPACDWSNARTAWLGVDEFWQETVPEEEVQQTRARFGIGDAAVSVVCVGRLDERKGQDRLLRAMRVVSHHSECKVTCLIVGSGSSPDYERTLHDAADHSGVKVVFLRDLTDKELRAVLAGSDVFCLPGRKVNDGRVEGFGLAYLEASAQGLPCIGPRLWAVPEVVRDGETGLLCDPDDDADLVAKLRALLLSPELRTSMGRKAHEHAAAFTWERCASSTYE
jgi:phosphatidylinositol alpha-1,6-mannosyltransferase